MAARFWTYILGWQIALALGLGWIWSHLASASVWAFALAALVAWGLLLIIGIGASFVLARCAPQSKPRDARTGWRTCRAFVNELHWFGFAWLAMIAAPLTRGKQAAPSVPAPRSGAASVPVLLLHGLSCNSAIWGPVRERLQSAGSAPVRSVDLEPLWIDLERYLPSVIEALGALERDCGGQPVTLIAHSIGGLVARALLRVIEPQRIQQIITLGTPHHGTVLARYLGAYPGMQLRPDSPWLQALNAAQEGRNPVPLMSIYSLDDNLIVPAESAALQGAQLLVLEGVGHFGLLHAHAALDLIEAAVRTPYCPRRRPVA